MAKIAIPKKVMKLSMAVALRFAGMCLLLVGASGCLSSRPCVAPEEIFRLEYLRADALFTGEVEIGRNGTVRYRGRGNPMCAQLTPTELEEFESLLATKKVRHAFEDYRESCWDCSTLYVRVYGKPLTINVKNLPNDLHPVVRHLDAMLTEHFGWRYRWKLVSVLEYDGPGPSN